MTNRQSDNRRKVALATLVGTTIEWYDFFIYGIAAALVFNEVFFPQYGASRGLLLSLATFGVSFVARPFGGLIAGQVGDRIGRKAVLVFTLMLMGVSSICIGLLPGYAQIGVAAPLLLVVLRFVQGLAVGGEWGGAAVMAVESAPEGRRGFWGAFPQMGGPLGLILANGVMLATNLMTEPAQFVQWGWRIPFLFSVLLLFVGMFIRMRIDDPTEAEVTSAAGSIWRPLLDVLREKKFVTTSLVFAQAGLNVAFYVFTVTSLTYLTKEVGVSRNVALSAVLLAAAADFLMQPVFGALSDRIGRRTVMIGGNLFLGLIAYPYFALTQTGIPWVIFFATILGLGIGHAATFGPLASLIAENYKTTSRYTGVSLANQIANLIWSAPTPFVAIYLIDKFGGATRPLTLLLVTGAVISIVGIIMLKAATAVRPDRAQLAVSANN